MSSAAWFLDGAVFSWQLETLDSQWETQPSSGSRKNTNVSQNTMEESQVQVPSDSSSQADWHSYTRQEGLPATFPFPGYLSWLRHSFHSLNFIWVASRARLGRALGALKQFCLDSGPSITVPSFSWQVEPKTLQESVNLWDPTGSLLVMSKLWASHPTLTTGARQKQFPGKVGCCYVLHRELGKGVWTSKLRLMMIFMNWLIPPLTS